MARAKRMLTPNSKATSSTATPMRACGPSRLSCSALLVELERQLTEHCPRQDRRIAERANRESDVGAWNAFHDDRGGVDLAVHQNRQPAAYVRAGELGQACARLLVEHHANVGGQAVF